MPRTLHRKIRNLEDSITKDMNPALEKAERTKAAEDVAQALRKVDDVIMLAKRLRRHVQKQAPPAAAS